MYQNRLLCFKVCWTIGIPENILSNMYPELVNTARNIHYFDDLRATNDLRATLRLLYDVIRNYALYTHIESVELIDFSRFAEYFERCSCDLTDVVRKAKNAKVLVNTLGRRANNLLADAYRELKLGLEFEDFLLLFRVPPLTEGEIVKTRFMMKLDSEFPYTYFFGDTILNSNKSCMFQQDWNLLQRISIVTGLAPLKLKDHSSLAIALKDCDDQAFIASTDLNRFSTIYIDTSTVEATTLDIIQANLPYKLNATLCRDFEECVSSASSAGDASTTAILAHVDKSELVRSLTGSTSATIILTMPVHKGLYKQILRRDFPDTYLLSIRANP